MGALITGLSSLIQPALSTILGGGSSTNQTNTQNSLASLFAPQSGTTAMAGSIGKGLGQLIASLQQLQQSNPTKYAQVTGQISTNLQAAAQTATASGNTNAASFLNQLATDFSNASKSGQMPSIQDLSQAVGGHHHHHHSGSSADPTSSSSTGTSAASSSTTGQSLDQLLASMQNSQSATNAINPLSIIESTLTSAGISA